MDTTTAPGLPSLSLTIDEMRHAYQTSDPAYRGLFFLGVRTTGIFCHPTCQARKPLPQNVEFFRTAHEAIAAGYRACKRCRPLDVDTGPPWIAGLLKEIEVDPTHRITEQDLRDRGIDPATARRFFRKHFGMTFLAYARAQRLTRSLAAIREGQERLDMSWLESGYESLSGFREAFGRVIGISPGRVREAPDCVRLSWVATPLGPMVAGAVDAGVCFLEFSDRHKLATQLATLSRRFGGAALPGTNEHLKRLEAELAAYFGGQLREFSVPVVYPGTVFQTQVWDELRRVPYGETRTYEQIAQAIGAPLAVRAVGLANGCNRLAIVVPCHRVVRKGGALGGYAGGLRRKQFLLDLERRLTPDRLF